VQALLASASVLQLWSVRDACARFLIDQLHPSNCLQIAAFANHHHCAQLTHAANNFVHQHFTYNSTSLNSFTSFKFPLKKPINQNASKIRRRVLIDRIS
jgi:hypothetical protein